MFDFVQNNKRLVQIFMALIILPFALWGIDSYSRAGKSVDVATVNGTKISVREFDNALRQQQARMRQQLGSNFDAAMLDRPEMKRAVIDNLISQRLLTEHAMDANLVVMDEQIARLIGSVEAFQVEGKFDKKRYAEVLSRQNLSPLAFEASLRGDLLGQQVQDAYVQNGFVSSSVVDNIIRLNEQQRQISVSPVALHQFELQAQVDDAAVLKYYEQNALEFQVAEQAKVEYVRLSVEALMLKINISKDELRKYYDDHLGEFGSPEELRAAHILISANDTAPQAEQDSAKDKAEKLLEQVRANPANFAELAKNNSDDPGSAANGGDLGWFGRGMMVKPFEDAVFALKKGEISGLVKTDFGFHIIRLQDIKPSRALAFDEVRESIGYKLRQQKAADMFAELAEKFSNVVYEQSDTLKPAAELAGTGIEKSGWLTKGAGANEPWTPAMLEAVFADDVTKGKRNTSAIEVAENTLIAARVLEYKPAAVQQFSEVKDNISQKLRRQKAVEMAVNYGKGLLEKLKAGDRLKLNWERAQGITRGNYGSLDPELVRSIFQADFTQLPQYIGSETSQGGYVIARIESVKDGDEITDSKRARYMQQLRQLSGEAMSQAFLSNERQLAKISVNMPASQP